MQHRRCDWLCHTLERCAISVPPCAATCDSAKWLGIGAPPWGSGMGLRSVPLVAVALGRCLTPRLQPPPLFRGTVQDLPLQVVVWITHDDSYGKGF